MKNIFITTAFTLFFLSGCASVSKNTQEEAITVNKWLGTIECQDSSRFPKHEHTARFIRKVDQKSFLIKESNQFTTLLCNSDKAKLIEIEGTLISRAFFWGENLVLKNYIIVSDLNQPLIHKTAPSPAQDIDRGSRSLKSDRSR